MFSTKTAGVLAIAATVCFLLVIVLQVSEMMSYGANPSVWPAP